MATLGFTLAGITAAFIAALGCYPAARIVNARLRACLFALVAMTVAAAPLWIPASARMTRLCVALTGCCLLFKVLDLYRDSQRGERPGFRELILYLLNLFFLVRRRKGLEKQPSPSVNRRNLLRYFVTKLLAVATFVALMRMDWTGLPFLLEHALKALSVFVFGISSFGVYAALFRAGGCYVIDPVDRPFAARSVAEFWRRYNRWIGMALRENVFKPAGGKRHPVRGTFAAFAVSGLVHEYLFGISIGGLIGMQTLFFLLQGCAVALTLRVRPTGRMAVAGMIATWSFMIVSSVLFFGTAQSALPFYQGGLPHWLHDWWHY